MESTNDNDEVGFLLVEDCFVHIVAHEDDINHCSVTDTKRNKSTSTTAGCVSTPSSLSPVRKDLPIRQWCNVNLNPKNDGNESPKNNVHATHNIYKDNNNNNGGGSCSRCNLVLKMCQTNLQIDNDSNHGDEILSKNSPIHFQLEKTPSLPLLFDGTVADMSCCSSCRRRRRRRRTNQQEQQNVSSITQRDDAALIMGLVMECQSLYNHVQIQQCQIMILTKPPSSSSSSSSIVAHKDNNSPKDGTCSSSSSFHEQNMSTQVVRAALLVTLTIPQWKTSIMDPTKDTIDRGPQRILSTTILQKNSSTGKTANIRHSKYLPPSTQLLFTLIRSDWTYLDQRMEQLKLDQQTKTLSSSLSLPSLFPPTMSLEELYIRLGTASHRHDSYHSLSLSPSSPTRTGGTSILTKTNDDTKNNKSNNYDSQQPHREKEDPKKCHFFQLLPMDLIQEICTYLRAKSLDALRCTCTELHQSTRHVVPGLRQLQLYTHQIKSLDWMRRRETVEMTEESILNNDCNNNNNNNLYPHELSTYTDTDDAQHIFCHGDLHRAVSGGNSVSLVVRNRRRPQHYNIVTPTTPITTTTITSTKMKSIRIDPHTGNESIASFKRRHLGKNETDESPSFALSRKVARGGLLCDDPGLGKTITVLSLILQTMGLDTEKRHIDYTEITTDEDIFNVYWKEEMTPCFRRPALNKLLMTLIRGCKHMDDSTYFMFPVDPVRDQCEDYLEVISHPICFNDILAMIGSDPNYASSFKEFYEDVLLVFMNATTYNPHDHFISEAALRLHSEFEGLVRDFKKKYVKSAKKSFSSSCAKPNSSVAAILEKQKRRKLLKSLIPSSSTLLVVPTTLENHWEEQINMHVDFSYCTSKIPIIFHYTPAHARDSNYKTPGSYSMVDIMSLTAANTHYPMIFIDRATKARLPSPYFLAEFRIVITTNQRLSNEWKNGSYEEELKENDNNLYRVRVDRSTHKACPLLKVHWLRLVVDEGHSMGRGGSQSNAIRFAAWIEAQRRWAMTGTPTPQTISQNGLSNILGLMRFLQHDFFSPRLDGDKVWQNYIFKSWNEGNLAAFFRLRSILLLLMVRHTKDDIEELSPPNFCKTLSNMSQEEITAYNTLVCAIQSNLVTTGMEGKTSGKQDSLLHRRQAKHAREALRNVRLACSGGTQVVPTLTQKNWDETLDLLKMHGVTGVKLQVVENFLHRAVTEQLSGCMHCGMQLSTLMVLPCADLVCTECMDKQTTPSCPVCSKDFDVDQFQLLQPGIDYTWKWNLEEAQKKEQQESSTSYQQRHRQTATEENGVDEDRHARIFEDEEDPPVAILGRGDHGVGGDDGPDLAGAVALQPASERRPAMPSHRPGDGHLCEYDPAATDGKCKLCFEEHDECVLIHGHSKCALCYRVAEPCPMEESKFHYISNKLEQLLLSNQYYHQYHVGIDGGSDGGGNFTIPSPLQSNTIDSPNFSSTASRILGETVLPKGKRPLKVILFSQFRPILNLVGHRLLRRFGHGCVAEYWGYARQEELQKFTKSLACFVMLLGKDGSEGLDLSFVTHIVFLDEVYDKSLENQVISRAYRMGAVGSVQVETLVAQNSVEELMTKLQEESFKSKRQPYATSDINHNMIEKNNLGDDNRSSAQEEEETNNDNDDDDDMEEIYSASQSGNTATKEYQSAKLHFLLKHLSLIRPNDNNTKNKKIKTSHDTVNDTLERPTKKQKTVMFHEAEDPQQQQETDNNDNNINYLEEESSSAQTIPVKDHKKKSVKFDD